MITTLFGTLVIIGAILAQYHWLGVVVTVLSLIGAVISFD